MAVIEPFKDHKGQFLGYGDGDSFTWGSVQLSNEAVLVVRRDCLNKIPEEEQRKFIELLKYKKVYVHKLPENCRIFVTYSNINENPIDEELYSFMVHI